MAGAIATRMLLRSNSVSVLMPGYRKILHDKYGHDNVHVRSHGILTARPQYPEFSRRGNPEHRILAFGKWGTYKRLELMIDAFRVVTEALPNVKLVIAGGNHPQAPGYVESIKKSCAEDPKIEFTGYLDEDRLPDIFPEFFCSRHAVLFVDRLQRRGPPGLRLWSPHCICGSGGFSTDGGRGRYRD